MIRDTVHAVGVLFLSCIAAACGDSALPDHRSAGDRLDSLEVCLDGEALRVRLFSSFGIGSGRIEFSDTVRAETLELELMYSHERPFRTCESLEVVLEDGSARHVLLERQPVEMADGVLTLPLDAHLKGIRITWIDFYR
ncbi:MAG: hypothetical protein R6U39_09330 [Candidatus Aegiribacteria sp.]